MGTKGRTPIARPADAADPAETTPDADRLTAAQERFCQAYLLSLNATDAYLEAYPKSSRASARAHGARLVAKGSIADRIVALQAERSKRVQIEADRVLEEIAALAFSNVDHFRIDELGNVVLAEGAPKHAMRAVASIKRRVTHVTIGEREQSTYDTELRLWSKPDALKMAGQHLALFTERREVTGKDGEPLIPIEAIRQAMRDAGEE